MIRRLICMVRGHAWSKLFRDDRRGYWNRCERCHRQQLLMRFT